MCVRGVEGEQEGLNSCGFGANRLYLAVGCQLAGSWVNSWLNICHDRAFERAGMPFSVLPCVHRGGT